jgi:hypothetical protein
MYDTAACPRVSPACSPKAPHLSPTQRQALERLILGMATWEPGHRISAAEVTRRLAPLAVSGGEANIDP